MAARYEAIERPGQKPRPLAPSGFGAFDDAFDTMVAGRTWQQEMSIEYEDYIERQDAGYPDKIPYDA